MTEESKRKKRQSSKTMIEKEIRLLGDAGNSEDSSDHIIGKDRGMFSGASSCRGEAGNPSMEKKRQVLRFSSCRKEVSFGGFVRRIISLVRMTFLTCYSLNFCVPSEFQC